MLYNFCFDYFQKKLKKRESRRKTTNEPRVFSDLKWLSHVRRQWLASSSSAISDLVAQPKPSNFWVFRRPFFFFVISILYILKIIIITWRLPRFLMSNAILLSSFLRSASSAWLRRISLTSCAFSSWISVCFASEKNKNKKNHHNQNKRKIRIYIFGKHEQINK